jgi:hypothetical protein
VTELYTNALNYYKGKMSQEDADLHIKVWQPTPYMIDVFTGETREEYLIMSKKIHDWCLDNLGKSHYSICNKIGVWQRGGATVDGWTWYGFKTEEMMNKFKEVWQTR